jgi:hypothetical protein
MSELPRKARGRRNQFFAADGVDELISMVLELAADVSALRERQYILEQVLSANGIAAGEAIEAWEPTAADREALAAARERMLSGLLRNLQAPRGTEVNEAAAAAEEEPRDNAA